MWKSNFSRPFFWSALQLFIDLRKLPVASSPSVSLPFGQELSSLARQTCTFGHQHLWSVAVKNRGTSQVTNDHLERVHHPREPVQVDLGYGTLGKWGVCGKQANWCCMQWTRTRLSNRMRAASRQKNDILAAYPFVTLRMQAWGCELRPLRLVAPSVSSEATLLGKIQAMEALVRQAECVFLHSEPVNPWKLRKES